MSRGDLMKELLYDRTSPSSIENYAKELIGMTFLDVLQKELSQSSILKEDTIAYGNEKRKGGLGNLLEEIYFKYKANSDSDADFSEAGVELKATPYEITKKGEYRAGERLVLTMINYSGEIEPTLYESHLWKKCQLLLLIFYHRKKELKSNLLYPISFVSLFTPSKEDLSIIESDYKIIVEKVKAGKAEELSESDTFYLGACTKGATAAKSMVPQFYPPHTLAKKRAFCYKNSYMTYVLNEYVVAGKETYEHILKDASELSHMSFSELIISKINRYRGKTDKWLCSFFDRKYNCNKAQWTDLAYRMLGIKSNRAAEFKKANIAVKVIRLSENGTMRENMSFPPFRYKELIQEEWDDSTLHNYFDETKLLFVVFKYNGDCYTLQGCQLWNMPYEDLNGDVHDGWEKVVETIKNGVQLSIDETVGGIVVRNNFPKKKDNRIIHVRPHANKRYFEFLDGTVIGDGSRSDANQLPDGTWMPHYSFWVNNDYILSQLDSSLK